MDIKKYKTFCCKSTWSRHGRADYRCDKCGKDVTMDIFCLYDIK